VPLLVPAYVIPLITSGHGSAVAVSSVAYTVVVCVLVGELVAWMSDRLRHTQARLQQRRSEERFRALVQHSSDVIAVVRTDGTIQYVTPSVTRVFGYRERELVDRNLKELLHPEDRPGADDYLARLASSHDASEPVEYRMRHRDGAWRHAETIGQQMLDDPHMQGLVLNTRDITERKLLEEQLRQAAFHDVLSGLPNRALFMDRLEHALHRTERRGHRIALLFLDLDNFKQVNDRFGHQGGDQVLVAVARRLQSCLRPEDTAARLGGDEFTVLLEDVREPEDIRRVASRILESIREPIAVGNTPVTVTASLGIVPASSAGDTLDTLLHKADIAMYRVKQHGKAGYALFDPALDALMLGTLADVDELRRVV
jgi:diguanylate cyclase (GGDEF)-like protein/PAS domain S-box-containing protein